MNNTIQSNGLDITILPPELWQMIFYFCGWEGLYYRHSAQKQSTKNIRLVCRDFCELGNVILSRNGVFNANRIETTTAQRHQFR